MVQRAGALGAGTCSVHDSEVLGPNPSWKKIMQCRFEPKMLNL